MFSIPLNQKLTEDQFIEYYNFCKEYKDYIYDIYFTCRMPPFNQDAMGDIIDQNDASDIINTALYIKNTLGIQISATFNNIKVPPTQQNLDLFILNFTQLYDAGITSATIPHSHWVATKQIQSKFPNLLIKNTILRNVSKANDVAKLAEIGFNYINLDRDLMRDRDSLIQLSRAAKKYNVKLSLLGNEGCLGGCPMMDEHFEFNNARISGPSYFHDVISRVSCPKWDNLDKSVPLKTANLPPWREDWEEMFDYVDVIKMHGRESISQLFNTIDIIKNYASNKTFLFDGFDEYIESTNLLDKPINTWRKIIKNCKFECWDCNFCDNLQQNRNKKDTTPLVSYVVNELIDSVSYNIDYSIPGLTSSRVQNLLYGISQHINKYLEVGSAMGATAAAVGLNNIEVHCIDNWAQNIQPKEDKFKLPCNTREQFDINTKHIKNINIHQGDFLNIDTSEISDIDLFFYDGPHDHDSTKRAVLKYKDCLADNAIIIFDDANWQSVVSGADEGIKDSGLKVLYKKLITHKVEDNSMWWNGLYICVINKEK